MQIEDTLPTRIPRQRQGRDVGQLLLPSAGTAILPCVKLQVWKPLTFKVWNSLSQVAGIFEEKGCSVSTYHERTVEVDGEQLAAEVMEIIIA